MQLALDTAFSACSVALSDADGKLLLARHLDQRRGQAETLVPLVSEILAEVKATPKDIEKLLVNTGPGTFAGVRIATAFARAMALSSGAKIMGITAFEALAGSLVIGGQAKTGEKILALVPGRRGEASLALFEVSAEGLVALKDPKTLPFDAAKAFADEAHHIAGPDLQNFEVITGAYPKAQAHNFWPEAKDLFETAGLLPGRGFSETVSPFYLRPPDATPQAQSPFA